MASLPASPGALTAAGRATLAWFAGWWHIVHFGALILVLALSPSSYSRPDRSALARHVYVATAPTLLWFIVLSSLISLVIIRIVVVTALSYGLSQYALQLVVRVLVLELIPLTAALFVAVRCALPNAAELWLMRARGDFEALVREGVDPLRREVLPRVAAALFATLMLIAASGVVTAILAYASVYGLATGGFDGYTRTMGRIFNPAVSMIFALKSLFFALAVALIPIATVHYERRLDGLRTSAEMQSLVRLFVVLLLIEVASLVGNYY